MGGGIDVKVWVFPGKADRLRGPRVSNVSADDDKFRKGQEDFVEVWNRSSYFGR